jgi:uncharacterized protein (DUF305 family)
MNSPYRSLAIAISINAVLMFFITYAMIDTFDHFYANINRGYMALMMTAPMIVVMLLVMRSMYENRKLNVLIHIGAILLFIISFSLARSQTPIGNVQFLRSMIPHHSSAVLMCGQASITDTEITELCDQIVQAQIEEIIQMKNILQRLNEQ